MINFYPLKFQVSHAFILEISKFQKNVDNMQIRRLMTSYTHPKLHRVYKSRSICNNTIETQWANSSKCSTPTVQTFQFSWQSTLCQSPLSFIVKSFLASKNLYMSVFTNFCKLSLNAKSFPSKNVSKNITLLLSFDKEILSNIGSL